MGPWVIGWATPLFNCEQLRSVRAVQLLKFQEFIILGVLHEIKLKSLVSTYFETVHGNPRSPSNKLQQPGPHLVTEGQDHSPIPLKEI